MTSFPANGLVDRVGARTDLLRSAPRAVHFFRHGALAPGRRAYLPIPLVAVVAILFVSTLFSVAPSARADGWSELPQVGAETEIILEDGTTLFGTILSAEEESVTIRTERFGELALTRAEVRSLRILSPPPRTSVFLDPETGVPEVEPSERVRQPTRYENGWYRDPDYNSLLLVPTSETLPAGDFYYRNFELLFNNVGVGVTDEINLSAMAAFPITGDFTIFGFGAKARLLSREHRGFGLAVAASATFTSSDDAEVVSAIASLGNRRRSLSAAVNVGFANGESATFILLGGDLQFAPRAKLLVEYGNSTTEFDDDEFHGLLNLGFRIFWETTSLTLTGFRPLADDLDDFLAFPLASFSAHF